MIIEASLLAVERIVVNGCRRRMLIELATNELAQLLDAKAADICE